MVAYALWSQQFMGLIPCPLCIFQRVAMSALGLAFLLAALPPDGALTARRCLAVLVGLAALVLGGISARHVVIQNLPEGSVPACGATLDYMLDVFPLTDVLRKVLTGSGECAKIDWTFLGLSMPGWVLAWAVLLGVFGFWRNWRR
jgi:disulfide bond formation protein DsbB